MQLSFFFSAPKMSAHLPALQQQPTAPVNSAYIISPPTVGRCALCGGKPAPIYQHPLHPPHCLATAPAASLTTARAVALSPRQITRHRDVDWLNLRLKQTNKQIQRATPYSLSFIPATRSDSPASEGEWKKSNFKEWITGPAFEKQS